jgi:hypothetical protein
MQHAPPPPIATFHHLLTSSFLSTAAKCGGVGAGMQIRYTYTYSASAFGKRLAFLWTFY